MRQRICLIDAADIWSDLYTGCMYGWGRDLPSRYLCHAADQYGYVISPQQRHDPETWRLPQTVVQHRFWKRNQQTQLSTLDR